MSKQCTLTDASGLVALTQAQQGATKEPAAEDRSQSFRPVEGGGDTASGEVLLVEAYAAFWLLAMALILGTWRRQKRLDDRIGQLKADIDKAKAAE